MNPSLKRRCSDAPTLALDMAVAHVNLEACEKLASCLCATACHDAGEAFPEVFSLIAKATFVESDATS